MNYYVATAFSFSIFLPGVLAALLFKKIDKRYYPFLFCLWAGCINEMLSYYLIMHKVQNIANNNIYSLLESILLSTYFLRSGLFKNRRNYRFIILFLAISWFIENFILGHISSGCTYFRIISSLVVLTMSIECFNKILSGYVPRLLRNPDFLLCSCFVIYFVYKALVQAFIIYGVGRIHFFAAIYVIFIYVNLSVNLLYIPSIIWMSKKARFILPLS